MARLVVSEFVSLDGVMQAPGGESGYKHTGWVMKFPSPDKFKYKLTEVLEHDTLLLGRKTYEGFAVAWPSRTGEFADKMNKMPKFVASTTLKKAEWNNSTILGSDVPKEVSRLKSDVAGDILVAGSRTLVNALKHHDLIDEYRLIVFPIVLGSGMRLFDDAADAAVLKLVDTHSFDNGAVVLTYHASRP